MVMFYYHYHHSSGTTLVSLERAAKIVSASKSNKVSFGLAKDVLRRGETKINCGSDGHIFSMLGDKPDAKAHE